MDKIIKGSLILELVITNIFIYQLRQSGMNDKMIERKIGISIKTQKRRCKNF